MTFPLSLKASIEPPLSICFHLPTRVRSLHNGLINILLILFSHITGSVEQGPGCSYPDVRTGFCGKGVGPLLRQRFFDILELISLI